MDGITLAKIYNDKTFNAMLGKYQDQEIADKYGCTKFFVTKIRKHKGIKAFRPKKYPENIALYAGKMIDKKAAEKCGCPPYIIIRYRYEKGIEPYRRREGAEEREKEIIAAYERLGTLQKVADELGVTRERVRQILVRAGYNKRLYNFAADK